MKVLAMVLILLTLVGFGYALSQVDKPRKPVTATDLFARTILAGLEVWLLWSAYL